MRAGLQKMVVRDHLMEVNKHFLKSGSDKTEASIHYWTLGSNKTEVSAKYWKSRSDNMEVREFQSSAPNRMEVSIRLLKAGFQFSGPPRPFHSS